MTKLTVIAGTDPLVWDARVLSELQTAGIEAFDLELRPHFASCTTWVGAAWYQGQRLLCQRRNWYWHVRLSQYLTPENEKRLLLSLGGDLKADVNPTDGLRPPAKYNVTSPHALRFLPQFLGEIYGPALPVQTSQIRDELLMRPSFLTEPTWPSATPESATDEPATT